MSDSNDFCARRHPRTDCVITVLARTAEGIRRGVCRSVSRGGAFITGLPQPSGEKFEVQLEVPGLGAVQAVAKVHYQHAHPDGFGIGVVFTQIADEHQGLLDRFIDLFARPRS